MPEASVTKYCCAYFSSDVVYSNPNINCNNTYTVEIVAVYSNNYFLGWGSTVAVNRSCATVTGCEPGKLYYTQVIGCLPKSIFPIGYNWIIYENGVEFDSYLNGASSINSPGDLECPDGTCPEVCS